MGWDLLGIIERDHQWRREHPDLFLGQIASDLWRTMDENEAKEDFLARAPLAPWWASDVVECLERVLRDFSDRVPTILVENGLWLGSSAEKDSDGYLDFLTRQIEWMRPLLDELRKQKPQP